MPKQSDSSLVAGWPRTAENVVVDSPLKLHDGQPCPRPPSFRAAVTVTPAMARRWLDDYRKFHAS